VERVANRYVVNEEIASGGVGVVYRVLILRQLVAQQVVRYIDGIWACRRIARTSICQPRSRTHF
jgi:hypothetical protein